MIHDTIDGLTIDWDEDGAHLHVSGLEYEFDLRVADIHTAKLLVDVIRSDLGSWVAEAYSAAAMPASAVLVDPPDEEDAYDLSDPKHPRHHEVMSEIWDNREKV